MHCYLKQRDNGIWYIWEYDESTGQCRKHTTRTRDRATADQALAQFVLSIPTRQKLDDPTVVQVLLRYWELYGKDLFGAGTVRLVMGRAADKIPETRVSAFTHAEQEKFIEGLWPGTARRYLNQVHAALKWAKDREELSSLPSRLKIKGSDRAGAKALSVDELRKLCEAATTTRRQIFLALMIATTQRPAHILELTWDRVQFDVGVIDYQDPNRQRTKKVRPTVPMCETLQRFLMEHKSVGYVVHRHGRRLAGHRTMFTKLCEAAGVDGSAYGIRKGSAKFLRRNGVPVMDLKGVLGHCLGGSTDRYAHADPEFMAAARAASEALLREIAPSWLAKYFPATFEAEAVVVDSKAICGAGNEARTRDLNLGKVEIFQEFPQLRPANDDF